MPYIYICSLCCDGLLVWQNDKTLNYSKQSLKFYVQIGFGGGRAIAVWTHGEDEKSQHVAPWKGLQKLWHVQRTSMAGNLIYCALVLLHCTTSSIEVNLQWLEIEENVNAPQRAFEVSLCFHEMITEAIVDIKS